MKKKLPAIAIAAIIGVASVNAADMSYGGGMATYDGYSGYNLGFGVDWKWDIMDDAVKKGGAFVDLGIGVEYFNVDIPKSTVDNSNGVSAYITGGIGYNIEELTGMPLDIRVKGGYEIGAISDSLSYSGIRAGADMTYHFNENHGLKVDYTVTSLTQSISGAPSTDLTKTTTSIFYVYSK